MTEQKKRIAAVGVFDGVHRGHRYLLQQLRERATSLDLEPVAVTFSNHPLSVVAPERAPLRLTDGNTRRQLLTAAGAAKVIELAFDHELRQLTAEQFMSMLHLRYGITHLLLGFNNRIGSDRVDSPEAYHAIGRKAGIEVEIANEYSGEGSPVSSSIIRGKLAAGDVSGASQSLGYDYTITGRVVTGKQLGRTIGFPTANVEPLAAGMQLPGRGVYAAYVITDDDTAHEAMLNIGHRPTVDAPDAPSSIEAHLLDFKGDLYCHRVTVMPVTRLRDEHRFSSLDTLKQQLAHDAETTRIKLSTVAYHSRD